MGEGGGCKGKNKEDSTGCPNKNWLFLKRCQFLKSFLLNSNVKIQILFSTLFVLRMRSKGGLLASEFGNPLFFFKYIGKEIASQCSLNVH